MWEFQLYLFVFGLLATRGVSGFYYGLNAGVTQAAAKSHCQSIGLRLAVLETLAEYEEAKAFLVEYDDIWDKGADVWIGLERDFSAPTLSFKWIDGSTLTNDSFGYPPWKSASIPSDDKACVMLDWGGMHLKFEPHGCSASKDFLCEGFHIVTSSVTWGTAKSGCEANNMKLASLPNSDAHTAASQFINVKRAIAYVAFVFKKEKNNYI
uniref:Uncharacterized protein n=1 Tax=Magallana gigas TaxID=29159 RepID=K1PFP2_MAGGI